MPVTIPIGTHRHLPLSASNILLTLRLARAAGLVFGIWHVFCRISAFFYDLKITLLRLGERWICGQLRPCAYPFALCAAQSVLPNCVVAGKYYPSLRHVSAFMHL
ncbi:uncharacterized protein BDV14DRAFT_179130 [Aspergillus stella-maris]|uniref:uncharacterized protein n=1 Tax=Aspergillus stella-maris TaxID=1810926 RepID=UPI003CCD64EC